MRISCVFLPALKSDCGVSLFCPQHVERPECQLHRQLGIHTFASCVTQRTQVSCHFGVCFINLHRLRCRKLYRHLELIFFHDHAHLFGVYFFALIAVSPVHYCAIALRVHQRSYRSPAPAEKSVTQCGLAVSLTAAPVWRNRWIRAVFWGQLCGFPTSDQQERKKWASEGGRKKMQPRSEKLGQRQRAAAGFRLRMFESGATCWDGDGMKSKAYECRQY